MKQRNIHKPKPELQMFYYTLTLVNGTYVAKQVHHIPKESVPENTSTLELAAGEEKLGGITGDTKFVLHITWLSGKPEPETEERGSGLMTVLNDGFVRLPLKVRKKLKKMNLALAHVPEKT